MDRRSKHIQTIKTLAGLAALTAFGWWLGPGAFKYRDSGGGGGLDGLDMIAELDPPTEEELLQLEYFNETGVWTDTVPESWRAQRAAAQADDAPLSQDPPLPAQSHSGVP